MPIYIKEDIYGFQHSKYAARLRYRSNLSGKQNIATFKLIPKNGKQESGLSTGHKAKGTARYITLPSIPNPINSVGNDTPNAKNYAEQHSERMIMTSLGKSYKDISIGEKGKHWIKWIYTERQPCVSQDYYNPCDDAIRKLEEEQIKQGGPPIIVYYTFAYNETAELTQKDISETNNYQLSNDRQINKKLLVDIAYDIATGKKLMKSGDPTGISFKFDNKDEKFAAALKLESDYRKITRILDLRCLMLSANPYDINFSTYANVKIDWEFATNFSKVFRELGKSFDAKSLESCKFILNKIEDIDTSYESLRIKKNCDLSLQDAREFYKFLLSNISIIKLKINSNYSVRTNLEHLEKMAEIINTNINQAVQNHNKNIDKPVNEFQSNQIKRHLNEIIIILKKINSNEFWDKSIDELSQLQQSFVNKNLSINQYNALYAKLTNFNKNIDKYIEHFDAELNELIYLVRSARVFFYREMICHHTKERLQTSSSQALHTHTMVTIVSQLDKLLEEIRKNMHLYGAEYSDTQNKEIVLKNYSIFNNVNILKLKYNNLINDAKKKFVNPPSELDFKIAYEQAKSHSNQVSEKGTKLLQGLNETRLYRDDDINDYLEIYIDKSFGGFDKGNKYLINRENISKITKDPNLLVAVTPAIDVYGRALKLDHFFNKQSNEGNALANLLKYFLKSNDGQLALKSLVLSVSQNKQFNNGNLSLIEDKLLNTIKNLFANKIDNDTLKIIYKELLEAEFDAQKIQKRIKALDANVDNRDVLDDVIPLLKSDSKNKARILMPYNHQGRNHWLTCEINIQRIGNQYTIDIYTHDPYGKGKMSDENFALLKNTITERISKFYDNDMDDDVEFTFNNKESPFNRRQAIGDGNACGVITIEDMINRVQNINLTQTYIKNATDVRENQVKFVKGYQLETGDNNRGQTFIARSFQPKLIETDLTNISWDGLDYGNFTKGLSGGPIVEDKATRLYTDDDINDVLEIYIANTIGFKDKCKYLINNDKLKNNGGNLIAITPAIDVMGRSLKLDHFLNKQGNSKNLLADHLTVLLPKLEILKTQQSKLIEILMAGLSGIDKAGAELIGKKLIEKQFDKTAIEEYIKNLNDKVDNNDALDEIIPLFKNGTHNTATILSPYNHENRNHWLTCQINITYRDNQYQVEICAHDPYGGGKMPKENYDLLCKTIQTRILELYKDNQLQPTFRFIAGQSTYKTRQQDGNSCGVIATEDLINIVENKQVDAIVYENNAPELRSRNIARVKEYQLTRGDKLRGKTFLERNDPSRDTNKLSDDDIEKLAKNLQNIIKTIQDNELSNTIMESFMNSSFFNLKDGSYVAGIHSVLGSAPQQLLLKGIKLNNNDLTQVSNLYNILFHPEGKPKVDISNIYKFFEPKAPISANQLNVQHK